MDYQNYKSNRNIGQSQSQAFQPQSINISDIPLTTTIYLNQNYSQPNFNPPFQNNYPPQQSNYPPQQNNYPPPYKSYPPQQSNYPPPYNYQSQQNYCNNYQNQSFPLNNSDCPDPNCKKCHGKGYYEKRINIEDEQSKKKKKKKSKKKKRKDSSSDSSSSSSGD